MAIKDEFATKVMGEVDAIEDALKRVTLKFNESAEKLPANLEISFTPIEKRLSKIATRIEKNAERSSLLNYSVVTVVVAASFGGGVLFSSNTISANWVIGGVLGVVVGAALTFFVIRRVENKYGEDKPDSAQKNSLMLELSPDQQVKEANFHKASRHSGVGGELLIACYNVLVNGMNKSSASVRHNVSLTELDNCISKIKR